MMGLLEYAKSTGDEENPQRSCCVILVDPRLDCQPGTDGPSGVSRRPPVSSLADVMVVASMAMELAAVSADPRYGEMMQECLAAAFRHYYPERHILMETAAVDGSGLAATPEERLFCPGSSK